MTSTETDVAGVAGADGALVAAAAVRPDDDGNTVAEIDGSADGSGVSRVAATPAALAMLRQLAGTHGPLMIHQSGGCCDGSSPMCYPRGEFLVGDRDVLLGVLGLPDGPAGAAGEVPAAVPVYIGGAQFGYWSHTHLTIDLVRGRGGGFSLEAPEGFRFLTRSRLFTDAESEALAAAGGPPTGAWEPVDG